MLAATAYYVLVGAILVLAGAGMGVFVSDYVQCTHAATPPPISVDNAVEDSEIVQCEICGKFLRSSDAEQWEVINGFDDVEYQTLCHACNTHEEYMHKYHSK
jgi:hypothetical protein